MKSISLRIKKFFLKIAHFFVNVGSLTFSQLLFLFLTLVLINVFSNKYFFRIDLTEKKQFSLSSASKEILSNLDDTVKINVYFSSNLPAEIRGIPNETKDLFEEMKRFSKGKIELNFKNPESASFKNDAIADGIPEIQYNSFSNDKFEIATGFLGAAIRYKDKVEQIKVISSTATLEYDTVAAIIKVTNQNSKKTIGFLTGHTEKDQFSDYTYLAKYLETEYEVKAVQISENDRLLKEKISTLIIAAPRSKFSDEELFQIDQFIMQGGALIVLSDRYQFDSSYTSSLLLKSEDNLNDLLEAYGIKIEDSVVMDESYMPINYNFKKIKYPYWVLVQPENIDKSNPSLESIDSIVFFWSNPIKIEKKFENQNFNILFKSSENSWLQSGTSIDAENVNFSSNDKKQSNLGVMLFGAIESKYKGTEKLISKINSEINLDSKNKSYFEKSNDSKILVLGDSDFIADRYLGANETNLSAFVNLVDYLNNSSSLMSIRSKSSTLRPIKALTIEEKNLLKILFVSVPPILILFIGFSYNFFRNKSKSKI